MRRIPSTTTRDGSVVEVDPGVSAIVAGEPLAGRVWAVSAVLELERTPTGPRASEERFRRLVENAPDAVFRYRMHPEPALEYASAAVREMTGYGPEAFYAEPALFRRLVYPEDAEAVAEALGSRERSRIVTRWRRRDGALIWAELRTVPVFSEHGRLVACEGLLRDVTARIAAREERERSFEQLLRRADEERVRLLGQLVHAQEEERRLIARDLHDDPVQVLAALAMRLELLAERVEDTDVLSELAEATHTARTAITGLRGLLFALDPPVLRHEGLAAALLEQLELTRQQTGAEVKLETRLAVEPPFETAAIAYRICQEALTNVRKHARPAHIAVRLDGNEHGLSLSIADDGHGFTHAPQQHGHLGLVSMRQRAELAAGWLRIDSTPGAGTWVEFFLPIHNPTRQRNTPTRI